MKIQSTNDVYIRQGKPSTSAPVKGVLYKGFTIEAEKIAGENYKGTDTWYKDLNGDFYWGGAFESVSPPIDTPGIQPVVVNKRVYWHIEKYKITEIWKETQGQESVIGILDTGICRSHPELKEAITYIEDQCTGNGFGEDESGHGSHCAGIIAGRNLQSVFGVAPKSKLLVSRVMFTADSIKTERLVAGLISIINQQPDIISLSLSCNDTPEIKNLITNNSDRICFVGSIGNYGAAPGNKSGCFPALYDGVISVGASDKLDNLFENTDKYNNLTICAPGVDINSTFRDKQYYSVSGTSMATAYISGIIALAISYLKQNHKNYTVNDLKQILRNTALKKLYNNIYPYYVIDPNSFFNQIKNL